MNEPTDIDSCLRVLARLIERPELCDSSTQLARVREQAARLTRVSRKMARQEGIARDREVLDRTQIRTGSEEPATSPTLLVRQRPCYVCGRSFREIHAFYDSLCPECAELNYRKRQHMADLSGRVALVTGGRVKIGYHVVLRLLRAGATVHVTTRFPHDAAQRYSAEPDFPTWADRLTLHALDLRALVAVEQFADNLVAQLNQLDIFINNAAQTVRRPAAYYRGLVEAERTGNLPESVGRLIAPATPSAAQLSLLPLLPEDRETDLALFPAEDCDRFGRPLDLREKTSWTLLLPEVELGELVEVHAINCLAPFVLLRRLDPLLMANPTVKKFIINVSSTEGIFTGGKSGRHPHTNMAKAALNMLTRTCAESYSERGIYMNSVDPGWVSNEAPTGRAESMEQAGFREPIDLIDSAARVLDPVFTAIETGQSEFGKLFKDYRPTFW